MRTRPCAAILAACRFECVWFALLHIREPENRARTSPVSYSGTCTLHPHTSHLVFSTPWRTTLLRLKGWLDWFYGFSW